MPEPARSRLTAAFLDPKLEAAFQRDTLETLRSYLRFSIALTSLVFLAYGLHDAWVVPEVRYDVWGDTVNIASRMESHSEPNSIQVTEATYLLLEDRYELTDRGEMEVKGKGRMRTWFLVAALPDSVGRRPAATQQPRKLIHK